MAEPIRQFNRYLKLTALSGQYATDLSDFRVRFQIRASDGETPNTAVVRVYNLSEATINELANGDDRAIIVDAGYIGGNNGTIFIGDVKQYRYGKENNTDRYLDFYAADGDIFYTSAFIKTNVAAGLNGISRQRLEDQMLRGAGIEKDPSSRFATPETPGGVLPRGRVLYGMARDQIRAYSKTQNARWSLQNGKVVFTGNSTYLNNGVVVELNALSGLIGQPEATDQGIEIKCLLNPRISIGGLVKIDSRLINRITQRAQQFPSFSSVTFPAITANDGLYRVMVVDYDGDTRGEDWYCRIIALAVNPDRPIADRVSVGDAP